MKILMVCLGNICRSPLAEGILKQKALHAGLHWDIESAGTNRFNMGVPPHRFSRKVAELNGIDLDKKRSRWFTGEDFDRFDKIYGMSVDVISEMKEIAGAKYDDAKVKLLLDELFPGKNKDIPDPWFGAEPDFHNVFKMMDEACNKIIEKYAFIRN
ncbi:MAG: low molecular weight protein-tyrosine-phosphatase [Chitinophagaceae bacterium]